MQSPSDKPHIDEAWKLALPVLALVLVLAVFVRAHSSSPLSFTEVSRVASAAPAPHG
ncbi:MAG TPA: hypothetical protein VG939_03145 [Caulobacteraceae bacterium]|nr:hypothetical protein [Caulobacteraceae bacterium]